MRKVHNIIIKTYKTNKIKTIKPGSPNKKQFFSHQPTHVTPIAAATLEAAKELGYNTSYNMNTDNFQIPRENGGSFSLTPVAIRSGARLSAEHLYLRSKGKKNLVILTNAEVTKVIIICEYIVFYILILTLISLK